MRKNVPILLSCVLSLFASMTWAHTGHGNLEWSDSIIHYFAEFVHIPVILIVALVALLLVRWGYSNLIQRLAPKDQG